MKDESYSYSGNIKSIRKTVFDLWVENPYLTAKKTCDQIKLNYKKHGNYVNKLLSEFRSYYDLGLPLEPQRLPHKRLFVWENIPRSLLPERLRRGFVRWRGWVVAANKNGMLVFRHDLGTVHWYRGGLVRLYLRGALQFARAKELFGRAFSWLSNEQLSKYLDVPLREESRHWVFEVGAPMPRFDIRQFEKTHGIRIFTDGSHPTAVEIEETQPFWIGELREATALFGEEIREHLNLIREWQKEAQDARRRKVGWFKRFLNWLW